MKIARAFARSVMHRWEPRLYVSARVVVYIRACMRVLTRNLCAFYIRDYCVWLCVFACQLRTVMSPLSH